jgi:hypothetical protein
MNIPRQYKICLGLSFMFSALLIKSFGCVSITVDNVVGVPLFFGE